MSRNRAWRSALLVAPVAAVLAVAGPPAQGATGQGATDAPVEAAVVDLPDVAAPQVSDPISDAEMRDLETLAEQSGRSLDEVIERYAWNDNFTLAVNELREAAPADFAGAAIVDADHAWIAFKGDVPEAMRAMGATFESVPEEVTIGLETNVGFSEGELDAAIAAAHFAALGSPGVADAVTTFDYNARQITTTVDPASEGVDPDVASLSSAASQAAGEAATDGGDLGGVAVKVLIADSATLGTDDTHYGGESLSGGACTSGFTVTTSGATSGTRGSPPRDTAPTT